MYDSPHVAAAEAEDARGDARDVERSYERSDEKKSDRCATCDALPASEVRACRRTVDGRTWDDRVWCPRARDVSGWPADAAAESARDESLAHFSWHWRRGHPIVVRGVHLDESDWTPESLERAMDGAEVAGGSERERHVGSERKRPGTDGPARSALRMVRVVAGGDDDDAGGAGKTRRSARRR